MLDKAIIFDLDGTLLDSLGHIVRCVIQASTDMGLAVPDSCVIRRGLGLPIVDQVQRLFPDLSNDRKMQLLEILKSCYYGPSVKFELFPDVLVALSQLKSEGVFLAIATGMGRRRLDELLANTELGVLMDCTRCADECPSKPLSL